MLINTRFTALFVAIIQRNARFVATIGVYKITNIDVILLACQKIKRRERYRKCCENKSYKSGHIIPWHI
jgi:hypothetical protein